ILHDALRPDRIYLEFEKALIGSAAKPLPRIGAVAESFLFYGDAPQSSLSYRLAPYLQEQHGNYLAYEHLLPPELRRAEHKPPWLHLYSYGALTYILFTGHAARGSFPPITESDPNIDPTWDEIVRECLRAPFGGGWTSMKQVITALRSIALRFNEATPTERMLQELSIPPGMSLVLFQDKVELGAADGPLTEQPRFRARIHPFFIDSTPVTVAEFREFLPSYRPSPYSSQPDSPATMISWHMAKGYCKWRSEKEGLPPDTYRLPTEYEWEAACRGMEGDQYPWGAEPDVRRIYCGQATDKGTLPVRALAPGRYGLYGMLGNVWEWTESVFKPHPFSKHHEAGYDAGLRTIKGGCWITPLHQCRGSARGAFAPNERRGNVGFRCARLVEDKNG
ncbi:MAG: formylglycine-generating enzyme family protein, partial [Chlamydiia bacterium]|nr:formylglycine-generating enzyme family protein [Chlamydiia bacterium]